MGQEENVTISHFSFFIFRIVYFFLVSVSVIHGSFVGQNTGRSTKSHERTRNEIQNNARMIRSMKNERPMKNENVEVSPFTAFSLFLPCRRHLSVSDQRAQGFIRLRGPHQGLAYQKTLITHCLQPAQVVG